MTFCLIFWSRKWVGMFWWLCLFHSVYIWLKPWNQLKNGYVIFSDISSVQISLNWGQEDLFVLPEKMSLGWGQSKEALKSTQGCSECSGNIFIQLTHRLDVYMLWLWFWVCLCTLIGKRPTEKINGMSEMTCLIIPKTASYFQLLCQAFNSSLLRKFIF